MDNEIKSIYKSFFGKWRTGNLVRYGNKYYYEYQNIMGFGCVLNKNKIVDKYLSNKIRKYIKI